MNNLISLLNTTLRMQKGSGREEDDEKTLEIEEKPAVPKAAGITYTKSSPSLGRYIENIDTVVCYYYKLLM